ncbi:MAG: hypothetical protein II794_07920 [Oscillospiraceae bacterium]|nr:hypothetical protein [Oscillospiraceae bacterium]
MEVLIPDPVPEPEQVPERSSPAVYSMKVTVSRRRLDDNSIGKEWTYIDTVNGESVSAVSLSPCDTVRCFSEYTEADSKPDIGSNYAEKTVSEADLQKGFTLTLQVKVTENGGRYSGKSAIFEVAYIFSPS